MDGFGFTALARPARRFLAALTAGAAVLAAATAPVVAQASGTAWTWGYNINGQLGDNTTTERWTPVEVKGPGGTGALGNVVAVTAGHAHTAALKSDGTVWAWGGNTFGQLGDNTTTERWTPVQVQGPGGTGVLGNIAAVAAGYYHTAALKADGTVWTWGRNDEGQLGDNTTTDRWVPVQVLGPGGTGVLNGIVALAGGYHHTIAVKADGTVWAWGRNDEGELGNNSTTDRWAPVQVKGPGGVGVLGNVAAVAGGYRHTAALRADGTVWAWGFNTSGQLGDNTTTEHWAPVQVKGPGGTGVLGSIVAVGAGYQHTAALKSDGTVWSWGDNFYGQVGDNTEDDRWAPVQVKGPGGTGVLGNMVASAVGHYHSVTVKNDSTVWGWGWNVHGQLGNNTSTRSEMPVQVKGPGGTGVLGNIVAVSGGYAHTAALAGPLPTYSVSTAVDPPGAGTVTRTPDLANYQYGEAVQLHAAPAAGWVLGGWTCSGGVVFDAGATETTLLVTGNCEVTTVFVPEIQPLVVVGAVEYGWVYQNAPSTTQGRHKCVLTISVTSDPNGNTTYAATVTRNASSTGQVVIESTANPLVWNIKGGQYGVDPFGAVTLDISVTGNEVGGTGTTTANLTVRRLSDITGNDSVGLEDKVQMNKRLNGLETPGYELRHFDLNGGGTVGLDDKLILNKILNGLPVP